MKNIIKILVGVFVLVSININAQNKADKSDDLGRIVLNEYVSEQIEELPSSAKSMLSNKLSQIASKNGMGGSSSDPRFIITPNIVVLTKDLLATAPPMIALTLEVTFYIGDGIEGILFTNESIEVKGVGTNETKAYIAALKQIKLTNPIIQNFVNDGKMKIIEYYNSRCDFIIKEAKTLEKQNEFEAAIFKLMSIPEVCKDCFDKSMDVVVPIYQKQINRECQLKLAEAKNIWNSNQDLNAANIASKYLSDIDPNAKCFNDAIKLSKIISKRVKELDQRDWDFLLKQQKDDVDKNKALIESAKEVGAAYGKNQPKNITYNTKDWW